MFVPAVCPMSTATGCNSRLCRGESSGTTSTSRARPGAREDPLGSGTARCALALKRNYLRALREAVEHVGVLLHHRAALRQVFGLVLRISNGVTHEQHKETRIWGICGGIFGKCMIEG